MDIERTIETHIALQLIINIINKTNKQTKIRKDAKRDKKAFLSTHISSEQMNGE